MPNFYTSSERKGIGSKKWRELFLLMLEGLEGNAKRLLIVRSFGSVGRQSGVAHLISIPPVPIVVPYPRICFACKLPAPRGNALAANGLVPALFNRFFNDRFDCGFSAFSFVAFSTPTFPCVLCVSLCCL